jgi:hypothetical protein
MEGESARQAVPLGAKGVRLVGLQVRAATLAHRLETLPELPNLGDPRVRHLFLGWVADRQARPVQVDHLAKDDWAHHKLHKT